MVDLTPKYPIISSSEIPGGILNSTTDGTVLIPSGTMVQPSKNTNVGGLQVGANSIQQGSGNDLFKVASEGLWLGAANFEDAKFSVNMQGNVIAQEVDFTGGTIGGFTITSTSLYGGIIKTAATVGAGSTGVIMDTAGLRGYDSVVDNTFNLPTDGSAPTFSSGIINSTIFEINTNAVLRTSETVGDGTANSAGVLINNTGIYGVGANQLSAAANVRILTNGDAFFSGTFNIGGTTITVDTVAEVQDALDEVETAGGGTVFLDNGTYVLTADITIPGGVRLEGVSRDSVIIDCDGTFAVKIAGTNVYSTGTVTINNGDATLEGAGTTWTAGMVGRYVLLDGLWYEITARTDNDTLTIDTYVGVNLAGSAYVLADTNFNATISKITVTGATGSGVVIQYAMEPNLKDIVVYGCGTGLDFDYVVFPQLNVVSSNENGVNLDMNFSEGPYVDYSEFNFSTTGAGVVWTNKTRNGTFFNTSVNDNTGNGITCTDTEVLAFLSLDVSGNGGKGIEFVSGCNNNQIIGSNINDNASGGIKFTATSDRNSIIGVAITNSGGYGINIAASTCDNNQIIAPAFDNNTSGNINDAGTNTFVSPQEVGANVETFNASGTWTKPSSGTIAFIQVWGGGGSGGKGTGSQPGGGGGGGGYNEMWISLASLGSTETVTVGAGGAASLGNGNAGGNSTFGTFLTGFGGGGGSGTSANGGGGGGGGSQAVGVSSTTDQGGAGGEFLAGTAGAPDGGESTSGGGGGGDGGTTTVGRSE